MKLLDHFFKNPWLLAVVSALLLRLAFPKFDIWPCAWIGLVPFFMALEHQRLRRVFVLSWLCGFVFFATTIYWLLHVTVAGMFVLSAYLGLFFVCFGLAFRVADRRMTLGRRIFFLAAFWSILEYLRMQFALGFPWALLAYSQTNNIVAIQVADIGGAIAVSFLLVLANALIFELVRFAREKKFPGWKKFALPLCVFVAWGGYGFFRIMEKPAAARPLLKVALVQGNISQEIKWVTTFSQAIGKKYQILSELARLKDEPDLIVWPETAVPDYLDLSRADGRTWADEARKLRASLLFGVIRFSDGKYFNSALLYDKQGHLAGVYDKIHLVPYGEYLPLRRALPVLTNFVPIEDFTSGRDHTIFSVDGDHGRVPFGVLVCFEDIFPDLAATLVADGALFLVNITNDAWFGDTASPYEHMQASVFRAVENRVPVVRAANTGISCVIDDVGRVTGRVEGPGGKPTYVTGFVTKRLWSSGRSQGSFYTYMGDLFVMGCLGMVVVFLWRAKRQAPKGA